MSKTLAYAATTPRAPLAPHWIDRREPGPEDVLIDILYCGVCHSDLSQIREDWGGGIFPMVPGHEIVGRVARVGERVTRLKVGELVAVGTMVDSCRDCDTCRRDLEQFCEKGGALTYNGTEMDRKTPTYGGYSSRIVVTEHFVFKIPDGLEPAAVAPLLCAGITTYSPLRQWNCKKGDRVAVVGLGGLGHMALKFAVSMGAEVTMLSTSRSKEADARRLGASAFETTRDEATFQKLAGRFDLILDTVAVAHDYEKYLGLLRPQGALVLVGMTVEPRPIIGVSLIVGNKRLAGSGVGGVAETQRMLEYCAEHRIVSDIEVIPIQKIQEAYERMERGDVRYRFVIDMSSLSDTARF
jgi:uncharacterized zinc-type alcohol dehydrogenase-like protein